MRNISRVAHDSGSTTALLGKCLTHRFSHSFQNPPQCDCAIFKGRMSKQKIEKYEIIRLIKNFDLQIIFINSTYIKKEG